MIGLKQTSRKGQVLVISACALVLLAMIAALTIDVGHMFSAKAGMQNGSDAASRAAILTLVREKLDGTPESEARAKAADEATDIASLNEPRARSEITFGRWDPNNSTFIATDSSVPASAAQVKLHRDDAEGSESVGLFFASLAGFQEVHVASNSVTRGANNIIGILKNGGLRPIAVPESSIGDWDVGESITVPVPSHSSSGKGKGSTGEDWIVPGNWGWLDFSGGSKGVPELRTWIDEGYDDDIALDTTGDDGRKCTFIEGTPGLRSTLYPNIDGLIGEEIVVTIFDEASEQGANAEFRIVGFLGIKITGTSWGHGAHDGEIEAEMIGISDNPKAILGTTGGSDESNLVKVQLVQ